MKFRALVTILTSTVALSACMTQSPAQVVMKGNNFYGTKNAEPIQVAAAAPGNNASRNVIATPVSKPEPQITYAHKAAPVAPVIEVASVEPRPSYGFKPSADTMAVRERSDLAQVTVKELEPLTASKATPVPETPKVVAMDLPDPIINTPREVLPEPQARVVANTSAIPNVAAPVVSANSGFIWPVKGKIISQFGPKTGGEYNDGINIAAHEGEPIVAAADGEVVYSGNELRGYGNMIIIRHNNGLMSAYAHADRVLVSKGESVRQGVTIATVGKSGGVDQAQVHFGVRKDKEPVDPMVYLGQNNYASR
ncbi:MAG: peptidoglycan DD-metalloendopeptidase family protein [Alphaproteobacteria bacterium]|nr:peptidoglycan DD-metalloendopeptidase family protein [Alphaproteobacteria bacterium]